MSLPNRKELEAAASKTLADLLQPHLKVVFVGINPGLYTAFTGFPYAHPANRFWQTMYGAGFTPRLFSPSESAKMLELGYGMTNVVARASVSANDLSKAEYIAGGKILLQKINQYKPEWVAFVGIQAYRTVFAKPKAVVGLQSEKLGCAKIWVLPSPSGLNAHYKLADFIRVFKQLHDAVK